jgi:hypothetical protein
MPRLHSPIDVAKELLFELKDKPDPSLNDIEALERLIRVAEAVDNADYPDGFCLTRAEEALQPFEDRYELARQGDINGN